MQINKEVINFTDGFSDLHSLEYKNILDNKGHTLEDCKLGIEITYKIRNQKPIGLKEIIIRSPKRKYLLTHLIMSYEIIKN